MVADTIYDTLTRPNADGDYEPWLAESVEPNDDYTQWTIKLREGVKFHDGSDLTAEVVKNNLDAYRGQYPTRSPLLFTFTFANIASVDPARVHPSSTYRPGSPVSRRPPTVRIAVPAMATAVRTAARTRTTRSA